MTYGDEYLECQMAAIRCPQLRLEAVLEKAVLLVLQPLLELRHRHHLWVE